MKKLIFITASLFLIFLLTACPQEDKQEDEQKVSEQKTVPICEQKAEEPPASSVLPVVNVELQPAAFDELKNWRNDNLLEMLPLLRKNCNRIAAIKSDRLGDSAVKVDTELYQTICKNFNDIQFKNSDELRAFLENNFEPFLVLNDGESEGKFTSYYESEISASYTKHGKYIFPIYGRPNDMFEIALKDFDDTLPQKRLVGRIEGQKFVPYYERADIENKGIDAPVLMWGDNPVDIHVMQIQGSAVAKMDDGSKVRVGYADNNGLPFKGIGSVLLEKKVLSAGKANMIEIKKWLNNNPEQAKIFMQENRRYIFHRIVDSTGPIGAFGVPLQAGRSLAVDRDVIPLGSLMWLETFAPNKKSINKLVIAQDIGGAIKGVVRGDYFWGSGGDDVLESAGSMNSSGKYFILLPKGQRDGLDPR